MGKYPGDIDLLIEIVGVDMTMKIVSKCGGSYLRIPKLDGFIKKIRNKEISRLRDEQKLTIVELARKFGLTHEQVSHILKQPEEELSPFELEVAREIYPADRHTTNTLEGKF